MLGLSYVRVELAELEKNISVRIPITRKAPEIISVIIEMYTVLHEAWIDPTHCGHVTLSSTYCTMVLLLLILQRDPYPTNDVSTTLEGTQL